MNLNKIKEAEVVVGNEGLKAYILKVYNYMMVSLGLTGVVSYLMLRTGLSNSLITVSRGQVSYSGLGWLVILAPLVINFFMAFKFDSVSAKQLKASVFTMAALYGASISLLIKFAGVHNAFQAFFLTGILFGTMSLYGYKTKKDLLGWGNILFMLLWGSLIVSLFSLFFGGVGIWFSYLMVFIFTGLIAHETQMIKNIYNEVGDYTEESDKIAVWCAYNLYLDFINIFIHLLRILSSSRNR